MTSLEEWAAIEAASWTREQEDRDVAHVDAHARFTHAVTVQLALRFSDLARSDCDAALLALDVARARLERSIAYLNRTTETLSQAVRIQAMGRR